MAQTQLTWYGHSAFKLVTPHGKVVFIDPWRQLASETKKRKISTELRVLNVGQMITV